MSNKFNVQSLGDDAVHGASTGRQRLVAASIIAVLFMGSTLLTPIYGRFQAAFGLSGLVLTVLYAVYVVGNLAALLVFGRLSDRIGRRPVVLTGLTLAALSSLMFAVGDRLGWLFAARVLSGLAVGVGVGAATAWLTESTPELQRSRAAVQATFANFLGLAVGPLLAGLLEQYGPQPLKLPFYAYLAVLAVTAALAQGSGETVATEPLDIALLRPRVGLPPAIRVAFVAPAVAVFATMALVGFYAALGPTMIRQDLHIANLAWSAAIVSELFIAAAVVILATSRLQPRSAMLVGLGLMPMGIGLLVWAQALGSLLVLLGATALCGTAAALGYRGSLQLINRMAPADQRAEVVSSYFLAGFCGNALPVIGVGVLTPSIGSRAADATFGGVVAAMALGALLMGWRFATGEAPPNEKGAR